MSPQESTAIRTATKALAKKIGKNGRLHTEIVSEPRRKGYGVRVRELEEEKTYIDILTSYQMASGTNSSPVIRATLASPRNGRRSESLLADRVDQLLTHFEHVSKESDTYQGNQKIRTYIIDSLLYDSEDHR